jgi:uncharacterized membrane protein YhaH (DUF805 family)
MLMAHSLLDLNLLFSPSGAIGRRPFWIGTGAAVALTIAGFVVEYLAKGGSNALTGAIFSLLLQLVAWVITFMLAIKRLRALGQSPWYVLMLFVPVINLIWYVVIGLDSADDNPEGESPADAGSDTSPATQRTALSGVQKFAAIAALIWFCAVSAWFTADVLGRYLFRSPVSGLLLKWTDNPDGIHVLFGWLAVIVALAGLAVLIIGEPVANSTTRSSVGRLHWQSRLAGSSGGRRCRDFGACGADPPFGGADRTYCDNVALHGGRPDWVGCSADGSDSGADRCLADPFALVVGRDCCAFRSSDCLVLHA